MEGLDASVKDGSTGVTDSRSTHAVMDSLEDPRRAEIGGGTHAGEHAHVEGSVALRTKYHAKFTVAVHTRAVAVVKFSPDGRVIASAGADRVVRLTSTASGRVLRTLEGAHSQGVCDVAWTCDGSYLASASDDATIALWDVATGKPACKAFKGHTNYVFCADFSPRCNILASGSYDESLRIWDVRSGKCIRVIPAHSEPVTSVQFNGDGTVLATGSYDGLVRFWDVSTGQCLKTLQEESIPPVSCVRFSPNSRYVLVSTLDGRAKLWDYVASRVVKTYVGHENTKMCAISGFAEAGGEGTPLVYSGSESGNIHMWDLQSKAPLQVIEAHSSAVLAVDAHPTEHILASGGIEKDNTVKIWYGE